MAHSSKRSSLLLLLAVSVSACLGWFVWMGLDDVREPRPTTTTAARDSGQPRGLVDAYEGRPESAEPSSTGGAENSDATTLGPGGGAGVTATPGPDGTTTQAPSNSLTRVRTGGRTPANRAARNSSSNSVALGVVNHLGSPVEDALVTLQPLAPDERRFPRYVLAPSRATHGVTNAEGVAFLEIARPGRYGLLIQAEGLAPLVEYGVTVGPVPVRPPKSTTGEKPKPRSLVFDMGTFELEPGVVLAGRVSEGGGAALAAANVVDHTLAPWLDARTRRFGTQADEYGSFELTGLGFGPWRLEASHPEAPTTQFEGYSDLRRKVIRNLDFELPESQTFRGIIAPEEGHMSGLVAVVDVNGVELTERRTPIDGAEFEIHGLDAAVRHRVVVREASHHFQAHCLPRRLVPDHRQVAFERLPSRDLTFALDTGRRVILWRQFDFELALGCDTLLAAGEPHRFPLSAGRITLSGLRGYG